MTTLKLDTLSDRIKAHKNALVHIVKPPVCTERAQHYTEMYQQHLDKPIPVRRASRCWLCGERREQTRSA